MYKIGIDLGGTNVVVGVVNEENTIIATASKKTMAPRPAEEIAALIVEATNEAVKNANITMDDVIAVGIGAPGAVNPKKGIIHYANNLEFYNVPLAKMVGDEIGKKVYLENDANAAAYGEYIAGAGVGAKNFMMITLGTGVGGGIVIDGKLYSGSNYAGAELGHVAISMDGEMCTCGRLGCWEAYASATALIRQTKQAMIKYPKSVMWSLCEGDINNVTGKTAFDAMRLNDLAGKQVVDKYVYYIAVGIANNINIFQPDIICIGGGVSKEGDNLLKPINKYVLGENYARNIRKKAKIKIALLGNDAGIIGAANIYKLQ